MQQTEARMLPAQQCLQPDEPSRGDVDPRLVVQRELVAHERVPQSDLEFLALLETIVQRIRVELESTAAALFRFGGRKFGSVQQLGAGSCRRPGTSAMPMLGVA